MVECGGIRLAYERASDDAVADLATKTPCERVATLAGYGEVLRSARAIHERIRFVR
jgi:hypothetical protein